MILAVFAASCGSEKSCPPPGIGDDCTDECADGLACVQGICLQPCTAADDCADGKGCVDGGCQACRQDGDCREGEGCDAGECVVVLKSRGEACQDGAECSSGFCVDSVCCESECAEGCMTCNGATPGRCEGDSAPECSVKYPEDAATIQDAIDSVGDGGVIVIGQGTDENIIIETDKEVIIEGDEQNPPEVTADDGQTAIHIKEAASVTIRNVQIKGGSRGVQVSAPLPVILERVHVRDAEVAVEIDHGAVWVPEAVAQLMSCDLFDNTKAGLVVRSAPVDVTGSRLHGNMRAVQVENTQAFNLVGTIVSQSHGNYGATFKDSDHVVIDGSLFWENNGLGAVAFQNVTDSEVKNSTFNRNGTAGIQVVTSSAIDIVDVTILDQIDTFLHQVEFNLPTTAVDLGDLELSDFPTLPKPLFPPLDLGINFGDDYWQGNGININNSSEIMISGAFLKGNEGSGILVRDSTSITVVEGHIFQNARSGIAADSTEALLVSRAGTYHNQVAAVQAMGGSSVIVYTSLSAATSDDLGYYGYGFSAEGGQHWVDYNYIYDDEITGIIMTGGAEVHFNGNEIHDSPWAVAMGVGCLPHEGVNEVSCTLADPCVEWHNMDPAPSPPPALPFDL
jgi:hypothetical protein